MEGIARYPVKESNFNVFHMPSRSVDKRREFRDIASTANQSLRLSIISRTSDFATGYYVDSNQVMMMNQSRSQPPIYLEETRSKRWHSLHPPV